MAPTPPILCFNHKCLPHVAYILDAVLCQRFSVFCLVPTLPLDFILCGERNETSLCVSWVKPSGGDAIDYYTLKWSRQNSSDVNSILVEHKSSNNFFYIIKGLLPGERVNASVKAGNSAGDGEPRGLLSVSSKFAHE